MRVTEPVTAVAAPGLILTVTLPSVSVRTSASRAGPVVTQRSGCQVLGKQHDWEAAMSLAADAIGICRWSFMMGLRHTGSSTRTM
jgi:hypothetical protein